MDAKYFRETVSMVEGIGDFESIDEILMNRISAYVNNSSGILWGGLSLKAQGYFWGS